MCGEVPIPISDFSSNPLLVPQPVQPWLNVVVAEGDKDDDDDFISTPRSRLLGKRKQEIIRPRDLLTQGCTPQQIEERLLDQLQPLMMENNRLTNQLEHYELKINRLTNQLEHYESKINRLTNRLEHYESEIIRLTN